MAPPSLPLSTISVTGPDGAIEQVVVFGPPATHEELVPGWTFFGLGSAALASSSPPPALAPKCPGVSLSLDVDQNNIESEHESKQLAEDKAYSELPAALDKYKSSRVAMADFVPFRCRTCGLDYNSMGTLRQHLRARNKKGPSCKQIESALEFTLEIIVVVVEEEEEEEDEPPRKKKKREYLWMKN
ncbi:hypothetical protein FALBO_2382 [Fusarium albosuccineum]|uniref:C2H2-type domain-containing protein n=1 Tax=Fusarium albosuccineum TaxID=1237068 RepID=A0A8H4LM56_9HYPO|nr:hypothetical protein FALBO_2382 [Fusarium albosuccineum]